MQKQITFGKWEAVYLLLVVINTQIFLSSFRFLLEIGGTATWILSIYICILAILGFLIISKLFKMFPYKDVIDISQEIFGKIGKIIIGLGLSLFILFITSMVLREFSENVKTIALTVSPLSYIMTFFILGMIIANFLGIEAIVRIHAIVVPILIIGYLIIFFSVSPLIQFDNLLPIMGNGFSKIFGEGFFKVSIFTELLIIFFLPPFLKSFSYFKSTGYTALLFSGFFITFGIFIYTGVTPYPSLLEDFIPVYSISRLIHIARFFERIEPLFLTIWILSALLYLSTTLYFSIYTFRKAFNLPYIKPLILPFSILAYNIAFLPKNVILTMEINSFYLRTLGFSVAFGLPILLLIIAKITKKGEKKK